MKAAEPRKAATAGYVVNYHHTQNPHSSPPPFGVVIAYRSNENESSSDDRSGRNGEAAMLYPSERNGEKRSVIIV